MSLPAFDADGRLPQGRHFCSLDEVEATFVLDSRFAASPTRQQLFADFLSVVGLLREIHPDLLERAWMGGGFISAKLSPSDLDVTFIVSAEVHGSLSNSKRQKIAKLCRRAYASVDAFIVARRRIANPWSHQRGEIKDEVTGYAGLRGAWDDWWVRDRIHGKKEEGPILADADPVRGYVEVMLSGADQAFEDPK